MVFNPDAGGVPSANMPDQTGASRGSSPNRSWEVLFGGLGDAVSGVVGAVDTGIKQSIKYDAQNIFQDAQKPYEVPPADLTKGAESIKTLQAAWEQGKLSDVHYYGLLATQTKTLRAKYPGYEDFVDQTIQEVTGVRPANSYRNAIVSELNSQQNAIADGEKQWKTFENQNLDTIAFLFPDYFTDPSKYNRDAVRGGVAKYLGVKNNDKYLKDISKENTYATAVNSLSLDVNTMIDNLGSKLGFGDKNIYTVMQEAIKAPMTEEQTLQLSGQLDLLITQAEANIDAQMMENRSTDTGPMSWLSILEGEKAKEVKEAVLAPLRRIRQFVSEGNYSMAAYTTKLTSAIKNDNVLKLLQGPGGDYFQAQMAADAIDPELFQTWAAANPTARDSAYTAAIPELMSQIATSDRNLNEAAATIANDTKTSEPDRAAALNTLLLNVNSTLGLGTKATPEVVEQVVNNTYSLKDGQDVFNLVADEDYMKVYTMLFDQNVTENLRKVASPEAWKVYREAAVERFQTVPEFRDAASALRNIVTSNESFNAALDDSGQLVVSPTDRFDQVNKFGDGPVSASIRKGMIKRTQETIDSLNYAFRILDPILLPEGASADDKKAVHQSLLNTLSINLSAGKDGNVFEWLKNVFKTETVDSMQMPKDPPVEPSNLVDMTSQIDYELPDQEASVAAGTMTTDLIKSFEGYRDVAYWDTNAYRTGYGSDTITNADGSVTPVSPLTATDKDGAERDLNRRVNQEFIPEIIEDVGTERWGALSERAQAALTSVAYNYGSLPSRVIKAIRAGDKETIAKAVEALKSHNNGINAKRRQFEADLIRS